MKIALLSIILLVTGGFLRHFFMRPARPFSTESSTIHYCGCIQDQPEYQKKVLDLSNNINDRIKESTEEFCNQHEIGPWSFDAAFIPHGNGNYTIKIWRSNQSIKIFNLLPGYNAHIKTLLTPHKKLLKEAHDDYKRAELRFEEDFE